MVRSYAFTTQGRLHTQDIEAYLKPTLLADTNLFLWVDLESPTPEETRYYLEEVFQFHPLAIDDCVTDTQAPKVEEYTPKEGDGFAPHVFMVIHAVDYSRKDGVFATNELDLFLGRNYLVTYHGNPIKAVATTTERSVRGTAHAARAPDRVAHTLLDAIVENYKPALEELALELGELESHMLQKPDARALNRIIAFKKEVLHLQQIIGPQREVLSRLGRGEFSLIRAHLVPYFRNVSDALFQIQARSQSYADALNGILQIYLSMSSNQTGEVIKLLTLITLLTTPLMMIGTWYGMNFDGMPELKAQHGYAIAALVMLVSTAATWWYFRRRNWF